MLKFFLLGAVCVLIGLPLIDGIVAIFNQAVQNVCARLALKVCKIN